MIHIGGKTYELVQEHKNGYSFEAFRDRYSEVLDRYDYIVGDWGYNQLRLKGFFKETNKNGTKDSFVSGMHDYLNEYCNFGCAYFILQKVNGKHSPVPNGEPSDESRPAPATQSAAQPQADRSEAEPQPQSQPQKPSYRQHQSRQHYAKGGSQQTQQQQSSNSKQHVQKG